ncbi:MAG: FAD-dependent monooxygenase [Bryobacterales bacterium]
MTDLEQDGEGVTAVLSSAFGETTIRARYAVGGDGMHSLVREAAGLDFEGGAYAESFVLADVRMDWPLSAEEVSLFFSPSGLLVVAPLPGERFRIVATVDKAPECPTLAHIQALVGERGPQSRPGILRRSCGPLGFGFTTA